MESTKNDIQEDSHLLNEALKTNSPKCEISIASFSASGMEHPKYTVYTLYSLKDHQFYIGYTINFVQRMDEHAAG